MLERCGVPLDADYHVDSFTGSGGCTELQHYRHTMVAPKPRRAGTRESALPI